MKRTRMMTRGEARREIVALANRARPVQAPPLRMRHLQHAVFVCRQRRLAPRGVLMRAGYNA